MPSNATKDNSGSSRPTQDSSDKGNVDGRLVFDPPARCTQPDYSWTQNVGVTSLLNVHAKQHSECMPSYKIEMDEIAWRDKIFSQHDINGLEFRRKFRRNWFTPQRICTVVLVVVSAVIAKSQDDDFAKMLVVLLNNVRSPNRNPDWLLKEFLKHFVQYLVMAPSIQKAAARCKMVLQKLTSSGVAPCVQDFIIENIVMPIFRRAFEFYCYESEYAHVFSSIGKKAVSIHLKSSRKLMLKHVFRQMQMNRTFDFNRALWFDDVFCRGAIHVKLFRREFYRSFLQDADDYALTLMIKLKSRIRNSNFDEISEMLKLCENPATPSIDDFRYVFVNFTFENVAFFNDLKSHYHILVQKALPIQKKRSVAEVNNLVVARIAVPTMRRLLRFFCSPGDFFYAEFLGIHKWVLGVLAKQKGRKLFQHMKRNPKLSFNRLVWFDPVFYRCCLDAEMFRHDFYTLLMLKDATRFIGSQIVKWSYKNKDIQEIVKTMTNCHGPTGLSLTEFRKAFVVFLCRQDSFSMKLKKDYEILIDEAVSMQQQQPISDLTDLVFNRIVVPTIQRELMLRCSKKHAAFLRMYKKALTAYETRWSLSELQQCRGLVGHTIRPTTLAETPPVNHCNVPLARLYGSDYVYSSSAKAFVHCVLPNDKKVPPRDKRAPEITVRFEDEYFFYDPLTNPLIGTHKLNGCVTIKAPEVAPYDSPIGTNDLVVVMAFASWKWPAVYQMLVHISKSLADKDRFYFILQGASGVMPHKDDPGTHKVMAWSGFPEDKSFGFKYMQKSMVLTEIFENRWAHQHTDLCNYLGWRIVQLNGSDVKNADDFQQVKASLDVGEPVNFTLEKVQTFADLLKDCAGTKVKQLEGYKVCDGFDDALFSASEFLNSVTADNQNRHPTLFLITDPKKSLAGELPAQAFVDSFFSSLDHKSRLMISCFQLHKINSADKTLQTNLEVFEHLKARVHNIYGIELLQEAMVLYLAQTRFDLAMEDISLDFSFPMISNMPALRFTDAKFSFYKPALVHGRLAKVGNLVYGAQVDISFIMEFTCAESGFFQVYQPKDGATESSDDEDEHRDLAADELDSCFLCLEEGQKRQFSCSRKCSLCNFAICKSCNTDHMLDALPQDTVGNSKCPACNLPGHVWKKNNFIADESVFLLAPIAISPTCVLAKGSQGWISHGIDGEIFEGFRAKIWKVAFHLNDEDKSSSEPLFAVVPETLLRRTLKKKSITTGEDVVILNDHVSGVTAGSRGVFQSFQYRSFGDRQYSGCTLKQHDTGKNIEVPFHGIQKLSKLDSHLYGKRLPFQVQVSYRSNDKFGSTIFTETTIKPDFKIIRPGFGVVSDPCHSLYVQAQLTRKQFVHQLETSLREKGNYWLRIVGDGIINTSILPVARFLRANDFKLGSTALGKHVREELNAIVTASLYMMQDGRVYNLSVRDLVEAVKHQQDSVMLPSSVYSPVGLPGSVYTPIGDLFNKRTPTRTWRSFSVLPAYRNQLNRLLDMMDQ